MINCADRRDELVSPLVAARGTPACVEVVVAQIENDGSACPFRAAGQLERWLVVPLRQYDDPAGTGIVDVRYPDVAT